MDLTTGAVILMGLKHAKPLIETGAELVKDAGTPLVQDDR